MPLKPCHLIEHSGLFHCAGIKILSLLTGVLEHVKSTHILILSESRLELQSITTQQKD